MSKYCPESIFSRILVAIVWSVCIVMVHSAAYADRGMENDDLYLTGYIKALMQEKYDVQTDLAVRSGVVFLPDSIASNPQYEIIIQDISTLKGVKSVKLMPERQLRRISRVWVFPSDALFRPLIADPRWPQFSAAYNYYTEKATHKHSADAALGKTFSFLRTGLGEDVFTEIGLQAAVFANFDLDTSSFDLVNADYLVGLPVTLRWEAVTVMGRIYHQSSHLGDEFLLHNKNVKRINLSYEAVDMIASFEPTDWFRLYGGLGNIFSRTPATYGKWLYQLGIELRVVSDYPHVPVTVLALDVKGAEETGYTPSWSALVGIEIQRNAILSANFYDGYSPNGQFYRKRVQWIGAGVRLFL